jgi:hypothetical protein
MAMELPEIQLELVKRSNYTERSIAQAEIEYIRLVDSTNQIVPMRERLKRIRAENPRLIRAFDTGTFC